MLWVGIRRLGWAPSARRPSGVAVSRLNLTLWNSHQRGPRQTDRQLLIGTFPRCKAPPRLCTHTEEVSSGVPSTRLSTRFGTPLCNGRPSPYMIHTFQPTHTFCRVHSAPVTSACWPEKKLGFEHRNGLKIDAVCVCLYNLYAEGSCQHPYWATPRATPSRGNEIDRFGNFRFVVVHCHIRVVE